MARARHLTRGGRALVCLLALLLVSGACTATGELGADPGDLPSDPSPPVVVDGSTLGGTLRIGVGVDPVSIDPRFLADDEGELVVDAIFDPLVRLDDDLEVTGAAARRWAITDDHRTFTFTLHDADFHDGTPVTAHDFVRTFDRLADGTAYEPSYLSYLLENVEGFEAAQQMGHGLSGIEAVDDQTLVIRLQTPDPGFLETLTDPSLVPLPAGADEDLDGFGAQPVGNGPFAMAGPREPNAFIRLVRFEDHRTPALLDEVLITVYPGDQGRDRQWRDVEDGTLHVAELSADRIDEAAVEFGRSPDGYRGPGVLDGVSSTTYLYAFDTTQPPFDDARVRRAISLSIDRESLAADVTQGARVAATSLVPPSIPGARPAACGACRHDPALARELLDEVRAEAAGDGAGGDAQGGDDGGQATGSGPKDAAQVSGDTGAATSDELPEALTGNETEGAPVEVETAADDVADDPDGTDPDGTDTDGTETDGTETDGTDTDPDGTDPDGADPDDPAPPEAGESPEADEPLLERLTLTHNRGVTHAAIAERMAADISDALDIEVHFRARELGQLVQDVRDGDVAVFRMGWDSNEPDPGGYLRPLFHSSALGTDNLSGYATPEIDGMLDDARATDDRAQRLLAYGLAERRILADLPVMPVLWHRHLRVVVPEVQDLVLSPLGRIDLARVWLDPGPG